MVAIRLACTTRSLMAGGSPFDSRAPFARSWQAGSIPLRKVSRAEGACPERGAAESKGLSASEHGFVRCRTEWLDFYP